MPSDLFKAARTLLRPLTRTKIPNLPHQAQSTWYLLPLELWRTVFGFLPKPDLIAFSSTSRFMRLILVPKLFECIQLRAGRYPAVYPNDENHAELTRRSIPVLRVLSKRGAVICGQYVLSDLVRSLRIIAGKCNEEDNYYLGLALRNLGNLRDLSLIGGVLREDESTTLARSCGPLETLRTTIISDQDLLQLCKARERYRSIELIDSCLSPSESRNRIPPFRLQDGRHSDVPLLVDRNRATLKKLAIYWPDMHHQVESLVNLEENLVCLSISGSEDLEGLDQFLSRAVALESLALLGVLSLSVLPCTESSLPKLRSLKLGIAPKGTKPDLPTFSRKLYSFLSSHRNISRFDFSTGAYTYIRRSEESLEENFLWISDIIEGISALHEVRAVGITFPNLTEDDIIKALEALAARVPSLSTCTALRIEGTRRAPAEIVTHVLRNCSFIALSYTRHGGGRHVVDNPPALTVEDLVNRHGLRKLQQVLLCDRMYDVLPHGNSTSSGITAEPWDFDRVRWRTEADFYNPDAHWLMSYRTISNGNRYIDDD